MKLAFILVCLCAGYAFAQKVEYKECRFSNAKKGYLQSFFMTDKTKIDTFPCENLLAKFKCGGDMVTVSVLSVAGADKEFNPEIEKVTVTIQGDKMQTLILTKKNRDKFLKKRQFDKDPWNWSSEDDVEKEEKIPGSYDKNKKAFMVAHNNFSVEVRQQGKDKDDEMRIFCAASAFTTEGTRFPNALCGLPDDSIDTLDDIVPDNKKIKSDIDLTGARWDVVQLSRQNGVQSRDLCMAAKEVVDEKCSGDLKQIALARCHTYYSVHEGDRLYGGCARSDDPKDKKNGAPINPFELYQICVRTMCHKDIIDEKKTRDWALSDDDCAFLRRVSTKCNNVRADSLQIGVLLQIGECNKNSDAKNES